MGVGYFVRAFLIPTGLFLASGAEAQSILAEYQAYDDNLDDKTKPTLFGLKIYEELDKGNLDYAISLLRTDMKGNLFPEINHWLLAVIAAKKKQYADFRKHIMATKKLPLLPNTKLVRALYEELPKNQAFWLVNQITASGYFDNPIASACPYFELLKRQERADFLYLICSKQQLNKKIKNNLFRELYVITPEAKAIEDLMKLKGFNDFVKSVPASAHVTRMENLLVFGKNEEARKTFTAATTANKKPALTKSELCELNYVDAKVDRKMRKYRDARERFKSLYSTCPDETKLKARFLDLMLAAQNGDEASLPDFSAFVLSYPQHSFTDDVLLFKANLLLDKKQSEAALKTLNEIIEHYPNGDMITRALFLKGFTLAKLNKIEEALGSFKELLKITTPSQLEYSQAQYWMARFLLYADVYTLDNLIKKNWAAAKTTLNELVSLSSPNVYSWLAYGLLIHVGEQVVIDIKPKLDINKNNQNLPLLALSRIENLVQRGFRREALALLDDFAVDINVNGLGTSIAMLYQALNRPSLGHQKLIRCNFLIAESVKREHPEIYQNISYPRPYQKEVAFATTKVDVPADIIFAIMREESGFISDSLSWAGARGLMQLMYPSALGQARAFGLNTLPEEDLYKPDVNILLASSILQGYWQRFGNIVVALAAYNAGPSMAKTWRNKIKDGPIDAFIEEISFKETRDYVKRVVGSIYTYGKIRTKNNDFTLKKIASIK